MAYVNNFGHDNTRTKCCIFGVGGSQLMIPGYPSVHLNNVCIDCIKGVNSLMELIRLKSSGDAPKVDCSICNSSASPIILSSVIYTICGACYEVARSLIAFINKLHNKGESLELPIVTLPSSRNGSKGFSHALKWVKEKAELHDEMKEKLAFLEGFFSAFKDHVHTDIQVKPGDFGCPIPAHRALLASRSCIFKTMLETDECITPANETITLPELNHEELECLLEFLYSGKLSSEKVEKHVYALSIAADKYEIPFLQKVCENQMLRSLNISNALDVLEVSDTCSNQILKEAALNFIVRNMGEIVFSPTFDAFALKNPHLSVQITRASFADAKKNKNVI